ncbi:Phosphodiesterase [Mycoplasma haemocanis str. Illinois]|uniref:Phosphodiesterase n=1 Tax=Mycoplasma haemocanis (strain Illinois) TaxID=1111676 RepID=H6N8K9_MYCHN|nr:HD domain-containing protein [Mycoplasma haemocanis]AEW45981.1 Phosphodiesterase [Mycoplasma haemocanis str. Illinois]
MDGQEKNKKDIANDPEVRKELEAYEKYILQQKQEIFNKIILNAIHTLKIQQPIISCCKRIDLSSLPGFNEETIGQLLGKDGQHKQHFINLTKVDLQVDQKCPNHGIVLSKYNSINVEKAVELVKKLLELKSWNLGKMKSLYEEVNKEFEAKCNKIGGQWLEQFLGYKNYPEFLATHVGTLQFVYSFSQNILEHSIEVAQLSANIAFQLGLDPLKAKRAGFFHDIGKAKANLGDHVDEGLKIGKEANFEEYILNTIESHHGRIPPNNPYAIIVKASDKLSAGREGARPRQMELIEKRRKMIEEKIMSISWIEKTIIKNAGNLIQIFIKPTEFHGDKLPDMKEEVRVKLKELNSEYSYNYQIEFHLVFKEEFKFSEK